ncbi:MAG TPA: rod shape-determining protein MreC [Pyrinomonadaceae bacterium]|nr:rod shape-determining protein MreC [Pyrinomonadaceae bacterium]
MRTQKEIRQRAPVWLVALLVVNFGLMSYDARDPSTKQTMFRVWVQALFSPAQRVVVGAGGTGVGFFQYLANLRTAASENEQLKARLVDLETRERDARAALDENERLKRLLDFKQESEYGRVPARVISRDPSAWFNSVVISRGTTAGVGLNMPVATPEGIVGRVVAVSPLTAQVMLITDDRSAAGAVVGQLGQSNALGSVRGLGTVGLLDMRYVSGLEAVEAGDYVVTTGQDGVYPAGLSVGTIVEKVPGSATTPHTLRIKPSARLDSLQEVVVLQYRPPPREQPTGTLPNVDKGKKAVPGRE